MLLELLQPYMVEKEPRAIPKYHTYLGQQNVHLNKYYQRFYLQHGSMSPAVNILRYILQYPDYEYLDAQTNNYDRYLNHLKGLHDSIISIFDRSQREGSYRKMFYHNGTTEEFILPVSDVNTIVYLPLGSNQWKDWWHVRPVRIWYNDSMEYTTNILNDSLRYTSDIPKVSHIMIDVHALLLKYYTWRNTKMMTEPNLELVLADPKTYFVHKYVMCPCIWDMANSWLLNIASTIIDIDSVDELKVFLMAISKSCDIRYGYIPGNISVGMESLWRVMKETQKSNLRPEALLSTKFFFNGSLIDRYNLSVGRLALPQIRRYHYHDFIRDKKLFELIVKIFKYRYELPTTQSLLRTVGRRYVRYLLTKPWNNCKRTDLQLRVRQEMYELGDLLEVDY